MNLRSCLKYIVLILIVNSMIPTIRAMPLGLDTEAPFIRSSLASIDYLDFSPDGDLSTFGSVVDFTDGISPNGLSKIGFGVGFDLSFPTIGATGGFDIFDQNGLFLGGDIKALGFTDNIIQFQFGSLVGSANADFGSSILMTITFSDSLGANPFNSFVDGESYAASISLSRVTAVPEPPSLGLVMSTFLMMLMARRLGSSRSHAFQHRSAQYLG